MNNGRGETTGVTPEEWRKRIERHEQFWTGQGRGALVIAALPRPGAAIPPLSLDNWQDVAGQAATMQCQAEAFEYYGDALPSLFPNLGPDFFPAGFGGELRFAGTTSHIQPFMATLAGADKWRFDFNNRYFKVMDELCDLLLREAAGRYLVQVPDFHPGADCLVGWRGPEQLCLDLYDDPDAVAAALRHVNREFARVFRFFADKLNGAGQPFTSWIGLISHRPYGIPSCDFSYLIGEEHFETVIKPALIEECRLCERNIFHVDGKGVLRHLDSILTLPNLQVIQWVPGAGNGPARNWIEVYRRCVEAGKAVQIQATVEDFDALFASLPPSRCMIMLSGVHSRPEMEAALARIAAWK